MTMSDLMRVVLKFLSNEEGLNESFFTAYLPKLCKVTMNCSELAQRAEQAQFLLAQS